MKSGKMDSFNATYGAPDVFDLAAEYGYAIACKSDFIDGNKRTAYVVTLLFLVLNNHDLMAQAVERVLIFEKLGKGGTCIGRICRVAAAPRKDLSGTLITERLYWDRDENQEAKPPSEDYLSIY